MRKFIRPLWLTLLVSVVVLIISSCKEDIVMVEAPLTIEDELTDDEIRVLNWNRPNKTVSYQEAENDALALIDIFSSSTRSGTGKSILEYKILSSEVAGTRSSGTVADTTVYLFNLADNGGFILISGDIRTERILCYVEEGNLNVDEEVDNPGFAFFLTTAQLNLEYQKYRADSLTNALLPVALEKSKYMAMKTEADATRAPIMEYMSTGGTGTLLKTSWHQGSPFNDKTKTSDGREAYAGCVAIATAQIMAYWQAPFGRSWGAMINDKGGAGREPVAQLISDIGIGVGMNYGAVEDGGGSGAQSERVPSFLSKNGYSVNQGVCSYKSFEASLRPNLDKAYPVYMSGHSFVKRKKFLGITVQTTYSGGHAWVCDGYKTFSTESYDGIPYLGTKYGLTLAHMNWGWGGSRDGYYNTEYFNANVGPVIPDTRGEANNYQYNIKYIPDIHIASHSSFYDQTILNYMDIYSHDNLNIYNVNIKSGATVNILARESIILKPSFVAEAGSNTTIRLLE